MKKMKNMLYYLVAFSIFEGINSPNRKIAESSINRLREKLGEEEFENLALILKHSYILLESIFLRKYISSLTAPDAIVLITKRTV